MRLRLVAILAFTAAALVACSSSGNTPRRSSRSTTTGAPRSTPPTTATGGGSEWPTYHRDPARSGNAPGGPDPATLHQLWASDRLDGDIYAEPLFVGDQVIVATQHDTVYSLDVSTGHVRWQTHLGEPVPQSRLPCGNIDPTGITSTPVVDPAHGAVDVVSFLQPGHHELDALDLASGTVKFRHDVDPPDADPLVQQQRAALAISRDQVYVGFGGLFGDCGNYRGYVVGRRTDGTGDLTVYRTAPKGVAVWAPSGPAVAADGSLLISTGNGVGGDNPQLSNSVIRLTPALQATATFTPQNQESLSRSDQDLGSVGPALLDNGLVFQIGKEGVGYLLRLDGLGPALFQDRVCDSGAYGGTAYAAPMLYVPCRDGLVAIRIGADRFDTAWRSPAFAPGAPIVTGGTVWAIDTDRGVLRSFEATSGTGRSETSIGPVAHFVTPTLANGRIVVAADQKAIAFGN